MNPQLNLMLHQAIQSFQSGNLDRAASILSKVLQSDSKNLPALHVLGLIKASQNKYKEAANFLLRAVKLNPGEASLRFNLAKALSDCGSDDEALSHHKIAAELDPHNPEIWLNYGKSVSNLNFHAEALELFDRAINLNPNYAAAFLNKGATLKELKFFELAVACSERALALNPNLVEAWLNMGVALKELKRYQESLASYDEAIKLRSDYAEAWSNKGVVLHELKHYEESLASYDLAIKLRPDYAEAWLNKGLLLMQFKRNNEAITHFNRAIDLKPNLEWVIGDLMHAKMQICSWHEFDENLKILDGEVGRGRRVINPFQFLSLTNDPGLQRLCAESYGRSKFPSNEFLGKYSKREISEKIHLGYFSADFRNHPVSFLTAELFKIHDRSKFEVTAFSFGEDDKSSMRLRLSQAFDRFIDVKDFSDIDIAKLSRELEIDIAVDLGGFTADSRTGIFTYRAAPIQISYLGYLGTMGLDCFDYLIADHLIISAGCENYYSEKIAYLPSYQVNDSCRKIADKKFTREELGLPEQGFIFTCFNSNYKILPATFDSWMRILLAVEGSVLFLYADNDLSRDNLRQEANSRGVNESRIIFGERLQPDAYLARFKVCDLFLDTTPYNAGTTASDALWAGLPVLTLMGQTFPGRVAASLLSAIGLPELITKTQEEYEALAIELAMNPHRLADIKLKLSNNRLTAPLFNTPLFTKNLEAAYLKMYERYQADLQPNHITIT